MKIDNLNQISRLIQDGTGKHPAVSSNKAPSFRDTLSGMNQTSAMKTLEAMSAELNKQGEVVVRRCDILELKRYKEMLGEFLHEACRFMYDFKKQKFLDPRGRHKVYSIIKRINKKLEELTEELLKRQTNNIAVMAAIDEIRGMLIDLML